MNIASLATLWVIHVAIAAALSIPIAAFSTRAAWRPWELVALILPFTFWAVPSFVNDHRNALTAVSTLTLAVPVAALVRVRLARHSEVHGLVAAALLTVLCLLAVVLYFYSPRGPF